MRCLVGPTFIFSTTAVSFRLSASLTGMKRPVPASLPLSEVSPLTCSFQVVVKASPRPSGLTSDWAICGENASLGFELPRSQRRLPKDNTGVCRAYQRPGDEELRTELAITLVAKGNYPPPAITGIGKLDMGAIGRQGMATQLMTKVGL